MKNLKRIVKSKKFKYYRRLLRSFSLNGIKPIGKHPFRIGRADMMKLRLTYPKNEVSLQVNHQRLTVSDSYWFPINFREIFEDEIYKFDSNKDNPRIIDCGSNIGLSVIYFKSLFPNSKVVAFEPDPYLFDLMKKNLASYNFTDIELHQQAVWIEEAALHFHPDRSLGGCLVDDDSQPETIAVPTIRLSDLINDEVDFLKIDIEGAEFDVLRDCSEKLPMVKKMFVEYHGLAQQIHQFPLLLQILEKSGFQYYIKEAYPTQHPFLNKERRAWFAIQQNIFAFRD